MTTPFDKKVEWNPDTDSFELVSNPEWDIEAEFDVYSELISQGFNDEDSSAIVSSLSYTRPVYACYCLTDHVAKGFQFIPCFCAQCAFLAKEQGFDVSEPVGHVSLHESTIGFVTEFLLNALDDINSVITRVDMRITEKDVSLFNTLLIEYGKGTAPWGEVVDSNETENKYYHANVDILEYFFLSFMLNTYHP